MLYFLIKSKTQFAVSVCPDDDLVEVETSRRDINVKWLLLSSIMQFVVQSVC
jgi:hypothetical protein